MFKKLFVMVIVLVLTLSATSLSIFAEEAITTSVESSVTPTETTTTVVNSYIFSVSPVVNSLPYYGGTINVNVSGYNLNYSSNLLVRAMATYYNKDYDGNYYNPSYNQPFTFYTGIANISNATQNSSYATATLTFQNNYTDSNIRYDLQYSNDGGKTWIGTPSSVVVSYNPLASSNYNNYTTKVTTRVTTTTRTTTTKAPPYDLSDTSRTLANPSNVKKLIANNPKDPITFVNIKNKESKEFSGQFNLANMNTAETNKLKGMSSTELSTEMTKISNSLASVHFDGVPTSAKNAIENAIRGQKAKVITMYFGLRAKFEAYVQMYIPYSRSDFSAGNYFLYKYNTGTDKIEYVSSASVSTTGVVTCSILDTQSTYFVCNQKLSV